MSMTRVFGSGRAEQDVNITSAAASSSALCIRNLPKNCRPPGSGCRRHVGGPPVPRLVGKQCERSRFFGGGRQAEFIRQAQAETERPHFIRQHGKQRRIVCAPAGYDQLAVGSVPRQNEFGDRRRDGTCRECGGRCNDVFLRARPHE